MLAASNDGKFMFVQIQATGIISFAGEISGHNPRSIPSAGLTIHRRNMHRRLQALPETGEGKKNEKYESEGIRVVPNTAEKSIPRTASLNAARLEVISIASAS